MKFNIKKFKNNILFFIVSLSLIVVLLLLSVLFGKKENKLDKVDLNDKDININELVINEIMTSNNGVLADENGKVYDYVELYNGSSEDVNLKNAFIGKSSKTEEIESL